MAIKPIHAKPLYTGACAVYPYSEALHDHFVAKVFGNPVPIARQVGKYLYVPRELAPLGEDRRARGSAINITCTVGYKPEVAEVQQALHTTSRGLLLKGVSHTLKAIMGIGKSYLGSRLICDVNTTTLIIVPKTDLVKQWIDNLLKYTTLKEEDIGVIQQDTCNYEGKKVCIGVVHSLAGHEYPTGLYEYFGLVVVDEAHRIAADTFCGAMFRFSAALRLALTATPNRSDGRSFVIFAHCGPILSESDYVQVSPKVLVVDSDWQVPLVWVRDEEGELKRVPLQVDPAKPAITSRRMVGNDDRNNLVVSATLMGYRAGRSIVLFFDSLKHIDKIKGLLVKAGIPAKEIVKYVGGIAKDDAENPQRFRVFLATYVYMGEGTDIPFLDMAVLVSPRTNISQAVGRILRLFPGKKQPVIVDIVDRNSPELVAAFDRRCRRYRELKAEIVHVRL